MAYIVQTSPIDRILRFISRARREAWRDLLDLDALPVILFTVAVFVLWGWWVWVLLKRRRESRQQP